MHRPAPQPPPRPLHTLTHAAFQQQVAVPPQLGVQVLLGTPRDGQQRPALQAGSGGKDAALSVPVCGMEEVEVEVGGQVVLGARS